VFGFVMAKADASVPENADTRNRVVFNRSDNDKGLPSEDQRLAKRSTQSSFVGRTGIVDIEVECRDLEGRRIDDMLST